MANQCDFGEFELLRHLTETPGVPGREERVRDLILKATHNLWDETRVDDLGNLICLKKATKKVGISSAKKVMLCCHMDEIGFYVRHIDEAGRLRLQAVGGFDERNLFSRPVLVQGQKDLVGIMNPVGKPIHLSSAEERHKIPNLRDFYVDLLIPKKKVDEWVSLGDPVTLIQKTQVIGDHIVGKCMDDRSAVWMAIEAIRAIVDADTPYDIYVVFSTQEEVGTRGAKTSAYSVDPDIGIAIDVTFSTDGLATSKDDMLTELGKGIVLTRMDGGTIGNQALIESFVETAKKRRIKYQIEVVGEGGTDADVIQRARAGSQTFTLSIPCRNLHTTTEIVHKKDLKAGVELLSAWLRGG